MPEKKTDTGRTYSVDGKRFTWHPNPDDDGTALPDVVIPMRIKLKVIRELGAGEVDAVGMFRMFEAIAPGQVETMDEMDIISDFQPMFETWQSEYNALSGASLGE